jgi:hypothetical protein
MAITMADVSLKPPLEHFPYPLSRRMAILRRITLPGSSIEGLRVAGRRNGK